MNRSGVAEKQFQVGLIFASLRKNLRNAQKKLCPCLFTFKLQAHQMKSGISLLVLFVSTALLAAAESYQPVSILPPSPPREFRAAWIATVGNKDWPSAPGLSVAQQKAELISLLDTAARLKFNAIAFQVRPGCDALYASKMEPWSEYLTGVQGRPPQPYYDPLEFVIEEAHRRGLEVHAWFNPFRARPSKANSPPAPNHVSRAHRSWVRQYGDQLWLDPGDPAVRDYVVDVIRDVVKRYDIDGVQFDDYYYPYPVESKKGGPDIPFPDDETWRKYGERTGLNREDWRRENINQFIHSVYQNIKEVKPWVKFGVCPFGIWQPGYPPQIKGFNSYEKLYSDSRLWLQNGWVDYISPQLYWSINSPQQSYPVLLNWWERQNIKGRNLWPGLAAFVAGTKFPVAEIGRQIQATRAQPGASGEIFFEMRDFQKNPALASVVANEYSQPALVPASPWLASSLPSKPELIARQTGGDWTFQWAVLRGNPAAKWLVQYCGMDNVWKTAVLPANQTAETFLFPPQLVSIRAMDRAGDLSAPAVIGKSGAIGAAAAPEQPKSFWNSYKEK